MKEIKAYIKPHKLSKVTMALHKVEGLTGMSVSMSVVLEEAKQKMLHTALLKTLWIMCPM